MKTLARLALALLCVAVAVHGANFLAGEGDEADCAQYTLPMCPRNYEPVCGSDGITYSNECMLCFDNSERKVNVLIKNKGRC